LRSNSSTFLPKGEEVGLGWEVGILHLRRLLGLLVGVLTSIPHGRRITHGRRISLVETGCLAVGGISGAISPKTMKHWVWDFIQRICELVDDVLRTSHYILLFIIIISFSFVPSYHASNVEDNLRKQTELEGYSQ